MFPAWPASGPEPHASRPSAHSFSAPAGPNLPFTFSSRSGQPVNRQMLFAASVFQTRKHEVHIFSASKTIASGLAGQYLPLPILLQPPTRQLIPFRRQPANSFRRISFHTSPHNLTLARNLHSGLTGQHASALILSLFFFYSTPFHTHPHTKKRKPAKPISISFSCNPKFSPNLVQASPSQSLSLLFSPSSQYTLLHRPRSGHT